MVWGNRVSLAEQPFIILISEPHECISFLKHPLIETGKNLSSHLEKINHFHGTISLKGACLPVYQLLPERCRRRSFRSARDQGFNHQDSHRHL